MNAKNIDSSKQAWHTKPQEGKSPDPAHQTEVVQKINCHVFWILDVSLQNSCCASCIGFGQDLQLDSKFGQLSREPILESNAALQCLQNYLSSGVTHSLCCPRDQWQIKKKQTVWVATFLTTAVRNGPGRGWIYFATTLRTCRWREQITVEFTVVAQIEPTYIYIYIYRYIYIFIYLYLFILKSMY